VTSAKEELKAARGEVRDAEERLYKMIDRLNSPELPLGAEAEQKEPAGKGTKKGK
jgi:hypothetical protein